MAEKISNRRTRGAKLALALSAAFLAPPLLADSPSPATPQSDQLADRLAAEFADPPAEARPRVWWHWINGNITQDGLLKDLAWMKRVGIGGAQAFDVNLQSPQIVTDRLVYMTPPWKAAFRAAAREAGRQGLELAIASSPGWSQTGGPWVEPADAMKKLVWSETILEGGRPASRQLALPPSVTGPFQSIAATSGTSSTINDDAPNVPAPFYRDAVVIAHPVRAMPRAAAVTFTDGTGKAMEAAALIDADLETGIDLDKATTGASVIMATFAAPRMLRSVTLFVPGGAGKFIGASLKARLEAEVGPGVWQSVTDIPLARVPTTMAFAPVTARHFRVTFTQTSSLPGIAPPPTGVDLSALAAGFSAPGPARAIRINELSLSSQPRVNRAEAKAGFDVVPDYYALDGVLADDPGIDRGKVIDLTDRLRADGTLDWTPPPGRWKVLRIGYSLVGTMNHPAPAEATGLEVDKYDGAAVRRYMDHYLGTYRDVLGQEPGGASGLAAILTDSTEVGASNWTGDMIARFRALRGYDPLPWLPALTGEIVGSRRESERFLFDFRRTLADLMASEHYGTIAKATHDSGLKVYGEALEDHRPLIGDDMAMRRWADVPMAAMWTFPKNGAPKPTYIADMKGAASVAHIYGKRHVAAESLTSMLSPWSFGPADLKRAIDLEFATGINRPVIHTSVHVPVDDKVPGLRLSIFGQDFNRNEAWAELARPWVDYIARNSLMLQQGRDIADIAYFHGEEAPLTALYGERPVAGIPAGSAYDFVNADALVDALSNDGDAIASSGGARYRLLYLGGTSSRMSLKVLEKIAALVEGGATVVGLRPVGDPGLSGDAARHAALCDRLWPGGAEARVGRGRVIATEDLAGALTTMGVAPDFAFSGAGPGASLPFVHRRLDDSDGGGDIYFLSNQKDRPETIEARFRVTGRMPELWHAETGRFEPVSYAVRDRVTVVPLNLPAGGSVHVVFRKAANEAARTITPPDLVEKGVLDGPWALAFQPGRGAPATAKLARLAPLDENADPAIRHFSGLVTYTATFTAPRGWKRGMPLKLDLGQVGEIAEVTVNGALAGHAWHAPYTVDIGAAARPGRNRLVVRVANLWVNRLIGDAGTETAADRVTWTATPTYRKDAPLRPSGLIGPVRLLAPR